MTDQSKPPSHLLAADAAGVVALPEATEFSDAGIVSRTVLASGQTRVILFGFAQGQELTEHASPSRALVQVLSGTCEFKAGGRAMTLRAGDLLHLPPRLPHSVRATEPFSMLLTMIREKDGEPESR